jgi:hypothetical protein
MVFRPEPASKQRTKQTTRWPANATLLSAATIDRQNNPYFRRITAFDHFLSQNLKPRVTKPVIFVHDIATRAFIGERQSANPRLQTALVSHSL